MEEKDLINFLGKITDHVYEGAMRITYVPYEGWRIYFYQKGLGVAEQRYEGDGEGDGFPTFREALKCAYECEIAGIRERHEKDEDMIRIADKLEKQNRSKR